MVLLERPETLRLAARRRRQRPAESAWILVANPPLCRSGSPTAALAACALEDACHCAVDLGLLSEDLAEAGLGDLISDWDVEVDPDTVAEVAARLTSATPIRDDEVADRLAAWADRLAAIGSNGSSLASVDEFE